jgi:hypothetical protein
MKKYSLIIWTFIPTILWGQSLLSLSESTKDEFDLSRKKEINLVKGEKIVKTDKTILIRPKKGSAIKLADDLTDDNYQINEYVGDLIKDKITLIKIQDYNSDRYIAVDLLTGEQKTFIGFPHVLGDNIICLQGVETDIVQEIEFWKIKDNKLTRIKTFNLPDKIYPTDIVWSNVNEVIIKDSKDNFWRTRVDGK